MRMERYILDGAYFETTREGGKSRKNVILTQPLRGWTPRPRNLPHVLPSVRSKQKQSCRPELKLMPCRAGTLGTSLGWSGYGRRIDTARSKSKPPTPYSRRLREETRAQPTKRGSPGLMFSTSDESFLLAILSATEPTQWNSPPCPSQCPVDWSWTCSSSGPEPVAT